MAVYKYVSKELITYLKDMYGITNTDKVSAKIVTKEFDCNGFIRDGEEIDDTFKIPKNLIVFTAKNGTNITPNAKKESKTDTGYRYLFFVKGDTGETVPTPSSKGIYIKKSLVNAKCWVCRPDEGDNGNIISFKDFKNTNAYGFLNDEEVKNYENFESIGNIEGKRDYKILSDDNRPFVIENSKTGLDGIKFFVAYNVSEDMQQRQKRDYYVIVNDFDERKIISKGTIFVHSDTIPMPGNNDIPEHSLIVMDMTEIEKMAKDFAAGSTDYLFMGESKTISDLGNKLVQSCNSVIDDTGLKCHTFLPNFANAFACKIGAMFQGWYNSFNGETETGTPSVNGDMRNFKYEFNATEFKKSNEKRITELLSNQIPEVKTLEEFDNLNKKIVNYCGGVEEYKPTDLNSSNMKIKSGLYELIKESEKVDKQFNRWETNPNSEENKEEMEKMRSRWNNELKTNKNMPPDQKTAVEKNLERVNKILGNSDSVPPIAAEVINDKENTQPTTANSAQQNAETNSAEKNTEEKQSTTSIHIDRKDMINYYKEQVLKKMDDLSVVLSKEFPNLDEAIDATNKSLKDEYDMISKDIRDVLGVFCFFSAEQAKIKGNKTCDIIFKKLENVFNGDIYKTIVLDSLYVKFKNLFESINDDTNSLESISINKTFPNDAEAEKIIDKAKKSKEKNNKSSNVEETPDNDEWEESVGIENSSKKIPNKSMLFEYKYNLYNLLKEANDSNTWLFINNVSLKNNAESNLFGRMESGKTGSFDDCYLTTSRVRALEGSAEKWGNSLASHAESFLKVFDTSNTGLIKTDTTLSLLGKAASATGKKVASVAGEMGKWRDKTV